jgi:hypothetical protein
LSKLIILKANNILKDSEKETIEKEMKEKTGINTVVVDVRFDVMMVDGGE